jgi:hypothetical protein
LNPKKDFSEFSESSDIDVINVSEYHYNETWERLRDYHRRKWYQINKSQKEKIIRYGQNVYCGFACPKWIPDLSDSLRFKFVSSLDTYSTKGVGYKQVNMLFFRNLSEVKDYYRRGIEIAKNKI